jgi:beta-galactosidase GanA
MAERYGGTRRWPPGTSPTSSAATTSTTTPTTPRRVPDWLREALRHHRRAQRRLGHRVLVAALQRLGQILPPRLAATHPNPGQQLDFKRFSSDALKDYLRAERDVLRELTPDVPVTTNFMVMGETKGMDYADWAAEVDFVANDHYVDHPATRPATSCPSRPTSPATWPAAGRGS